MNHQPETELGNVTVDEWIARYREDTRFVAKGWMARYFHHPDGLTYYDLVGENRYSMKYRRCRTDEELRHFLGAEPGKVLQGRVPWHG